MTDELGREELLKWLDDLYGFATWNGFDDSDKSEGKKEQIKAMLQKPGVTEKWIKKKIDEMWIKFEIAEVDCEDFIRSFVEAVISS